MGYVASLIGREIAETDVSRGVVNGSSSTAGPARWQSEPGMPTDETDPGAHLRPPRIAADGLATMLPNDAAVPASKTRLLQEVMLKVVLKVVFNVARNIDWESRPT